MQPLAPLINEFAPLIGKIYEALEPLIELAMPALTWIIDFLTPIIEWIVNAIQAIIDFFTGNIDLDDIFNRTQAFQDLIRDWLNPTDEYIRPEDSRSGGNQFR